MFTLRSKDSSKKNSSTDAESLVDPAIERITNLWEFVRKGLYKSHPDLTASRLDLLKALCDGAGATLVDKSDNHFRFLGSLDKALSFESRSSTSDGLNYLRLHKGNSKKLKEMVIEALEAYGREVECLDGIEQALRERQVGFREPEEKDWSDTWAHIRYRVEATGNKLMHYHARMNVLQLDIEKEALVNELDSANGWVVFRHILYPPRRKMVSSIGSSAH